MLLERIYTACSHAIVLYRIGLRSLSFVFDYWWFRPDYGKWAHTTFKINDHAIRFINRIAIDRSKRIS